jgi:hypothetical protein
MSDECTHLDEIDLTVEPSGPGCQECLATGGRWMHLRRPQAPVPQVTSARTDVCSPRHRGLAHLTPATNQLPGAVPAPRMRVPSGS